MSSFSLCFSGQSMQEHAPQPQTQTVLVALVSCAQTMSAQNVKRKRNAARERNWRGQVRHSYIFLPHYLSLTIYKCSKMINSHVHTTANLKYVFQWKVPGNTLGNVSHVLITHTLTLNMVTANCWHSKNTVLKNSQISLLAELIRNVSSGSKVTCNTLSPTGVVHMDLMWSSLGTRPTTQNVAYMVCWQIQSNKSQSKVISNVY